MDEQQILDIIRKERDKKRTIYIEISELTTSDFLQLRKKLKKKALKLVKNMPCILGVKDDEDVNIRDKDCW